MAGEAYRPQTSPQESARWFYRFSPPKASSPSPRQHTGGIVFGPVAAFGAHFRPLEWSFVFLEPVTTLRKLPYFACPS